MPEKTKTSRGSLLSRIRGSMPLKEKLFEEMNKSKIPLALFPLYVFKNYLVFLTILFSAIFWFFFLKITDLDILNIIVMTWNLSGVLLLSLSRVESSFKKERFITQIYKDILGMYSNNYKANFKSNNKLSLNACKILAAELSPEEMKTLLSEDVFYKDLEVEKYPKIVIENEKKLLQVEQEKNKLEKIDVFVDSLYK